MGSGVSTAVDETHVARASALFSTISNTSTTADNVSGSDIINLSTGGSEKWIAAIDSGKLYNMTEFQGLFENSIAADGSESALQILTHLEAAVARKPVATIDSILGEKEAAGVFTNANPGQFSAAKHVPIVTIEGGQAKIEIPAAHGMAEDHWIEYMWARDQGGAVLASVKLTHADKSELTFAIPAGTTSLTAFEWCNKHGAWSSDPVAIVASIDSILSEKEAAGVFTNANPGQYSAAKHVPIVTIEGGQAKVEISAAHGMAEDHWIEYMWARDQGGAVLASVKLTHADKSELTFAIPAGTTSLTAFEWCNKHGAWSSDAVPVSV